MVAQDAQVRVDKLRQRLARSSAGAQSLYTAMAELPDRELSVGFSFVNSVHNDVAPAELAAANKAKLQAILDSLSEKKTAALLSEPQLPEPQLADTGAMSPSPMGLPSQGSLRAKLPQLT